MANLNAGPTLTAYECLTLADCCPCLTSMYYVFVFFFFLLPFLRICNAPKLIIRIALALSTDFMAIEGPVTCQESRGFPCRPCPVWEGSSMSTVYWRLED